MGMGPPCKDPPLLFESEETSENTRRQLHVRRPPLRDAKYYRFLWYLEYESFLARTCAHSYPSLLAA